jgi:histidinol phosphatase-like enzyme (inositol monophosphatase family)
MCLAAPSIDGSSAVTSARNEATGAFLEFAHVLADISGEAILPHFRKPQAVKNKAGLTGFDPVTAADRAAERAIRKAVVQRFPGHGIVGEEYGTIAGEGRYSWLVDPIDGTRAFITGSPLWGTLIALLDGGMPTLGLMNQPFTGERCWSEGRHARWRGADGKARRIRTRACARLADAILTTTHPDMFAAPTDGERFNGVRSRARMTRYGGDCYGYCLLAAGFIDIIVESGLKPYDIVPLVPIIEAAGGVVTTWEGEPALDGGRIVAAGDRRVHEQALAILRGAG